MCDSQLSVSVSSQASVSVRSCTELSQTVFPCLYYLYCLYHSEIREVTRIYTLRFPCGEGKIFYSKYFDQAYARNFL